MTAKDNTSAVEAVELPDATDLDAVNRAEVEVIRLAARRQLSALEALRFSRMLDHRRRAIAAQTFEEKMADIDRRLKAQGR